MSKKNHAPGPVPPENRSHAGPNAGEDKPVGDESEDQTDTGFNEQDPKRRLGNFTGAGEAAFKQPGGRNDANHG